MDAIVESLWVAKEPGLNRFVCEQPAYHMLDRTAEREVIPAARSFGLAVIPWGPLCGGLLTGKYDRDRGDPEGRWQALYQILPIVLLLTLKQVRFVSS